MTDSWKARVLVAVTSVLVGCGTTDTTNVDLTGTWVAAPNSLGVATIDVTLTESASQITGTGTFVGMTNGLASGTLTADGIHLATELNLTLHFTPEGAATLTQNLTGHVDDNDHFILIFPAEEAQSVTFTRQ
jgi:hypothetical protein